MQCQWLAVNDKFHLLDVGLKHLLVIFQEEYQTRLQAPKLTAKEQSVLWFIAQKVVQNFQAPLTLYSNATRAPTEFSNSVQRYMLTVHIGTYYKRSFSSMAWDWSTVAPVHVQRKTEPGTECLCIYAQFFHFENLHKICYVTLTRLLLYERCLSCSVWMMTRKQWKHWALHLQ